MPRTLTISLPVTNLERSVAFYTGIGFEKSRQFADDAAALMIWSDAISLMLLTHDRWNSLTARPIPPSTSSEVALMLSCDTREEVDAKNRSAGENGGISDINPVQDHGFMYGRDFTDPDGHVWGAMWMDPSAMPCG